MFTKSQFDGKKSFEGVIHKFENDTIYLKMENDTILEIPISKMKKANLVYELTSGRKYEVERSENLLEALDELEREKGIKKDELLEAVETALLAAYKKNYGDKEMQR